MAAKCPFCGETIETEGTRRGDFVQCPVCRAEVNVDLLGLTELAPPSSVVRESPKTESYARDETTNPDTVDTPNHGGGVIGSYSYRSDSLTNARETIFSPDRIQKRRSDLNRQNAPTPPTPPVPPAPPAPPRPSAPPPKSPIRGPEFPPQENLLSDFDDSFDIRNNPSGPTPGFSFRELTEKTQSERKETIPVVKPDFPLSGKAPSCDLEAILGTDFDADFNGLGDFLVGPGNISPATKPAKADSDILAGCDIPNPSSINDIDLDFGDLEGGSGESISDFVARTTADDRFVALTQPQDSFFAPTPNDKASRLDDVDLDAVLHEDSFVDAVAPWGDVDPGKTVFGIPEAPSASRDFRETSSSSIDTPFATSSLTAVAGRAPLGGAGASYGGRGRPDDSALSAPPSSGSWDSPEPESSDGSHYNDEEFGLDDSSILDIDIGPAPVLDHGGGAPSVKVATIAGGAGSVAKKGEAKKGGSRVIRVAVLSALLIGLVGVILGQTSYGYFASNFFFKGHVSSAGRTGFADTGREITGIAKDTRQSYIESISKLEASLKEDPDETDIISELVEVATRYRERYPEAFKADTRLQTRLAQLRAKNSVKGWKASLIKAMDLIDAGDLAQARVVIDGIDFPSEQYAEKVYFYGKIALGQEKLAEAQQYFEQAVARNASMLSAKYFLATSLLKQDRATPGKEILKEILAIEPDHLSARVMEAEIALKEDNLQRAGELAQAVLSKGSAGSDLQDLFKAHRIQSAVLDRQGQPSAALVSLRTALGLVPTDEATAINVGRRLLETGKRGEAYEALRPCREGGCKSIEFLSLFVSAAFEDDKSDLAEAAIDEGLKTYPESPVFSLIRGRNHLEADRFHGALSSFEEAVAKAPQEVDGYIWLSTALSREGKLSEASKRLEEGIEKTEANPRILAALANLFVEQRKPADAEKMFRRLLEARPQDHEAQQALGLLIGRQGRAEEALAILSDLNKKKLLTRDGIVGLAEVYLEMGKASQARDVLAEVYLANPDDADVASQYGRALGRSGDDQMADKVLVKVIREFPTHHRSQLYLGLHYRKIGEFEKSVEALEGAVKMAPENTNYRLELARTYLARNTPQGVREAKNQLDMVTASYGRDDVARENQEPDAWMLRGKILFEEQKYTLAMKDFNEALNLAPSRMDILLGYGRSLYEMARFDEALPYFKQVVDRDPAHSEANFLLARISIRHNKIKSAKKYLIRAIEKDPKAIPEAHRLLGMIYRDENMSALALKSLSNYLKYCENGSAEAVEVERLMAHMRKKD